MQAINMQEVETAMNKYGDIVLTKNEKNNVIVLSVEQYKEKLLDEEIEKDSKKEIYEIEFTEDARDEIREIYEYISKNLVNEDAAKRLMRKMRKNVMDLAESPKIYAKIKKKDRMKREFRRMVVDNFIVLYTIDENKKTIYISHMYYGRRNYL